MRRPSARCRSSIDLTEPDESQQRSHPRRPQTNANEREGRSARPRARPVDGTPLDTDEGDGIAEDLRKKYGNDLTTEFKTNPDLIGGLRVRVGSDVWDGSVRARLQNLGNKI